VIKSVHANLGALSGMLPSETMAHKPAVPIRKSVTDAYVICLEDGKKLKILKRYLRSNYNLTIMPPSVRSSPKRSVLAETPPPEGQAPDVARVILSTHRRG
jgi:hypothetical protein